VPHLTAYLIKLGEPIDIIMDAASPGIWTGWLALLLLVPLDLTSNDAAVRWLGPRWERLHKLAYVAALCSFAHWILVAFSPGAAWAHHGVLVALEFCHLVKGRPKAAIE
jgi:sulfoxide reductase heme-binding subunit YedZ